ncbi:MAG: ABC transporter permease [Bryobacterales bacterium]|jgi:ABC-2 type transport system permease protein|nr:ABC transporter permease [Bryobacterales bacterium]
MNAFWVPTSAVFQRDLLRFWRERSRVAGFALTPVVFWVLVGSGYSNFERFLPGALVLTVMFSAIFSAMSLIEDRKEGFLLSMLASPAPRITIAVGKIASGSLIAVAQAMLFLLLATVGGTLYPDASLAVLFAVCLLIAAAFTAAGLVIAWLVASSQGFHAVINLIFMPLWMLSGAIFTLTEAQPWLRYLMLANPVTYAQEAMARGLGLPVSASHPVGAITTWVVLTVTAIATLVASVRVLARRSERNLT